ncbi:MAG: acetyl-coenzyme A synthetase, partial [Pedosphaera sp.]|nr:acetyl-coenzyme A synthetase [Pedosphaera sp.]
MSAKQPSAADNLFPPPAAASACAHIRTLDEYRAIYAAALQKPDQFWASQAERISWFKKWDKVSECDYHKADIQWYLGGKLNASYNCVDRHVEAGHGDVTALIWEGNDPNETRKISYAELHAQVQRAANA